MPSSLEPHAIQDLRAEPSLCALAQRLCSDFSQGARDAAVDDNLDLPRNLMDEVSRPPALLPLDCCHLNATPQFCSPPAHQHFEAATVCAQAATLCAQPATLCAQPATLCTQGQRESGLNSRDTFLADVDRGLEPPRGEGERCWVLDPIDGTKGFMTGQGFVIGLALLDANGDALVGVMGVPALLKAASGQRRAPLSSPATWGGLALRTPEECLGHSDLH